MSKMRLKALSRDNELKRDIMGGAGSITKESLMMSYLTGSTTLITMMETETGICQQVQSRL